MHTSTNTSRHAIVLGAGMVGSVMAEAGQIAPTVFSKVLPAPEQSRHDVALVHRGHPTGAEVRVLGVVPIDDRKPAPWTSGLYELTQRLQLGTELAFASCSLVCRFNGP